MKVWVNGELRDEHDARVAIFDHGLTVGDGVFEAIKVIGGVPFALTRHLQRLRHSALGLGLGEPDLDAIRSGVAEVIESAGRPARARIRITVTGGHSPLSSERGGGPLTAVVALEELGPTAAVGDVVIVPWAAQRARRADRPENHLVRGERACARLCARARRARGDLRRTPRGTCARAPARTCSLSAGDSWSRRRCPQAAWPVSPVALVIEWCGAQERDVPLGALAEADEAFLTSTMRDVQAIRSVDGRPLPAGAGPGHEEGGRGVRAARGREPTDPVTRPGGLAGRGTLS